MIVRYRVALLILCICLLASLYVFRNGWLTPSTGNWKLVWSDEFDKPTLDLSKWNLIDTPSPRNNELEYYTPDEVSIIDGVLRIRTEQRDYKGLHYTSGAIHTKNKFQFLYGKVEIHAKLPKGKGIWPAHWMIPSDHTSPFEIDIMEMLGQQPDKIYMTHHWLGANRKQYTGTYTGSDYSQSFHTFSIEWEPGKITWYIDGIERYVSTSHVQDTPAYLYLNTAVGGNWPGAPDDSATFPQYHDIDYIRVYQK